MRRTSAQGAPATTATPAGSGGLPADVDELAAALTGPSRYACVVATEVAAAAPAVDGDTEASSQPETVDAGPDVEPDARPPWRGYRRGVQRVDVPGDVARANQCTPPAGGPFSVWR